MILVVIESPYAGNVAENLAYLAAKRLDQYIEYRTLSEWRKGLKNA